MTFIVYKVVKKYTGEYYIGKTSRLKFERNGYHGSGRLILKALKKYGEDMFTRTILFETDDEKLAYEKEVEFIGDKWKNDDKCYNTDSGGAGCMSGEKNPSFGLKRSPEVIEKQRLSRIGRKIKPEARRRLSEAKMGEKNPMYGSTHTQKQIEANKAKHIFKWYCDPKTGATKFLHPRETIPEGWIRGRKVA